MEEKILIESCSSKKTRQFFIGGIIFWLIVSAIFLVLWIHFSKQDWADRKVEYNYYGEYYECELCGYSVGSRATRTDIRAHVLKLHSDEMYTGIFFRYDSIWWAIIHWSTLFLAGIFYLIYYSLSHCKIVITDKNISGRTFWGKKVILPIHMISAFSISKIFSVVAITSSSGCIKFPCIGNREKIAKVLQQLLNERQTKTEIEEKEVLQNNNLTDVDYLIKLKNLLDNNIITQEEFEKKKKEILGI